MKYPTSLTTNKQEKNKGLSAYKRNKVLTPYGFSNNHTHTDEIINTGVLTQITQDQRNHTRAH